MAKTTFRTGIHRKIADKLGRLGFEEKRSGIFLKAMPKGWNGWIGLNHATFHKAFVVNPIVGVRFAPLETALQELLDRKVDPYIPPSLRITLTLLSNSSPDLFTFEEGVDPDQKIDNLATTVKAYAVPYIQNHCSLEAVAEGLAPWGPDAFQTAIRYPITLKMLGRTEKALKYVAEQVACLEGPPLPGSYQESYREFALRFRKFAEVEGCGE